MTMAEKVTDAGEATRAAWRFKRRHAALMLLAVAAVFAVRAKWFSGASHAASEVTADPSPGVAAPAEPEPSEPEPPPEPAGPSMLGSWRDKFYGERTMTFLADGTGTMVIRLDSIGQAIYGEKLLFELAWENRDGVLVMKFTGGEPKNAVALISKGWGDTHEQKIELLTDAELHLRSTDSQNLYKLQRVAEDE
jgi:hypothetical protein